MQHKHHVVFLNVKFYGTKLLDLKRLVNWDGHGRKQSWPNWGYYLSAEVGIACWTAQGSVPGGRHKIFASPLLSRLALWPIQFRV